MEVKERILIKASEMFFKVGIRSITMDDIAKELGISKKTIYINFPDKDSLVFQIMANELEKDRCDWININHQQCNQLEKLLLTLDHMKKTLSEFKASTLFEIKRYFPKAWQLFETHKINFIIPCIEDELIKGIDEGLYRHNMNVKLLARYRYGSIMLGFDTTLFDPAEYNILELQETMMDHFIRAILTDKGLEIYNTLKNK
jgi:TetR/AcrR family transcriptional regulator, cholesterol catabolism regulator